MPHLKKSSISALTNSMHCGTYIVKDTHDTWRFLSIQTKHCTMLALIHKILISNYLKVLFQSAIFHATWLTIFSKQQDKSHEILIIWNICHDTSCCVAAVLRYSTFFWIVTNSKLSCSAFVCCSAHYTKQHFITCVTSMSHEKLPKKKTTAPLGVPAWRVCFEKSVIKYIQCLQHHQYRHLTFVAVSWRDLAYWFLPLNMTSFL